MFPLGSEGKEVRVGKEQLFCSSSRAVSFSCFFKASQRFSSSIRPAESHRDKVVSRVLLFSSTWKKQTQSTRGRVAGSNFRGQILYPITLQRQKKKKETISFCNFTTRGSIVCPLVRPFSDTLPNLGVGVGCAGVKMSRCCV